MPNRKYIVSLKRKISKNQSHLRSIVQEGEYIIRRVPAIHRSFLKEVSGAFRSLLKVLLLPRLDVVHVDRDEVVPVRPRVLVHEAESVKQFVNRAHQVRIKAGPGFVWISYDY